jgi:hypothetical protein
MDKRVVATWSGGIDSTGVIANLLSHDWQVLAVSLAGFNRETMDSRERAAREALRPHLEALGEIEFRETSGAWLSAFAVEPDVIPTRNKRMLDHLIAHWASPRGISNLGMGEYIGCDSWVVRDHVGAADCDARSLTAYLYEQYGMDWRLFTLADFGESRFKSDRVGIGFEAIGQAITLTTNCLHDVPVHCGRCYKCYERAAAFDETGIVDDSEYAEDPRASDHYHLYRRQMAGERVSVAYDEIA